MISTVCIRIRARVKIRVRVCSVFTNFECTGFLISHPAIEPYTQMGDFMVERRIPDNEVHSRVRVRVRGAGGSHSCIGVQVV